MLVPRVQSFALRHSLWQPETRLVVALSGGSDSVALLHILKDLHDGGELRLDAAAHVNHGIRGAAADEDEQFCRHLCAALDVPFEVTREDVPALARRDRTSIEVAARRARRAFLLAVLASRGADSVATAHTRDDQAETVLMRLVRGAGLNGAAGIAPRRGAIVRPLLGCGREELRAHLAARGQAWREDATNADVSMPRNRVRHEILPQLEKHFNPQARVALARFAEMAREDEDSLAREAAAAAVHVIGRDTDRIRLNGVVLTRLPLAVARRVARAALESAGYSQPTSRDIETVIDVAKARVPAAEVPGLRLEHWGQFVVLVHKGSRAPSPFRFLLSVPGSVEWPHGGWVVAATGPVPVSEGPSLGRTRVLVDASRVGPEMVVRSRQAGDWLRPVGLGGRKKVQDLLVDRKVRAEMRKEVPIVTLPDGRIVWVAGHALDAGFRPSSDTNSVVILELRRIGRASGEGQTVPGSSRRPR
jgi:tRNA(Ile)-lysidine synthase